MPSDQIRDHVGGFQAGARFHRGSEPTGAVTRASLSSENCDGGAVVRYQ